MARIQPIIFCIEFPSDLAFTISRINLQTDYSLAFFDLSRTLLNENETDEAPGIIQFFSLSILFSHSGWLYSLRLDLASEVEVQGSFYQSNQVILNKHCN